MKQRLERAVILNAHNVEPFVDIGHAANNFATDGVDCILPILASGARLKFDDDDVAWVYQHSRVVELLITEQVFRYRIRRSRGNGRGGYARRRKRRERIRLETRDDAMRRVLRERVVTNLHPVNECRNRMACYHRKAQRIDSDVLDFDGRLRQHDARTSKQREYQDGGLGVHAFCTDSVGNGSDRLYRLLPQLLGEADENSFGSANVAQSIRVFVLDYLPDKFRAAFAKASHRIVDILHSEHHA
jgi:hypothetical protein